MSYVDGFVIPVPKNKVNAYMKMAREGLKLWKKHGALDYKECQGNDLKNAWGSTFPKLAKTKPNETVFFSFIVYKNKAHRNKVNAKVMKEMEMKKDQHPADMPFDMKRMAYGGFATRVE